MTYHQCIVKYAVVFRLKSNKNHYSSPSESGPPNVFLCNSLSGYLQTRVRVVTWKIWS